MCASITRDKKWVGLVTRLHRLRGSHFISATHKLYRPRPSVLQDGPEPTLVCGFLCLDSNETSVCLDLSPWVSLLSTKSVTPGSVVYWGYKSVQDPSFLWHARSMRRQSFGSRYTMTYKSVKVLCLGLLVYWRLSSRTDEWYCLRRVYLWPTVGGWEGKRLFRRLCNNRGDPSQWSICTTTPLSKPLFYVFCMLSYPVS